jgi:hypothetical protein
MKKTVFACFLICVALGLTLMSCNQCTRTSKTERDSISFQSDTGFVGELNDRISPICADPEDSTLKFQGKGKIWRLWQKLHKNCHRSVIAEGMLYFGVTNTLGLGTILNIDSTTGKINADYPMIIDSFSTGDRKLAFNFGSPADCEFDKEVNISAEFLVKSKICSAIDVDLQAQIDYSKKISAKIDSWQINNLYLGGFAEVISDTSKKYFSSYKKRLKMGNKYVITKEIQINGFSTTITTKNKIGAELST